MATGGEPLVLSQLPRQTPAHSSDGPDAPILVGVDAGLLTDLGHIVVTHTCSSGKVDELCANSEVLAPSV